MKKQIPLIFGLFFAAQSLLAQKESSNWYFGENAGVTFNSGAPVALTDGALFTHEGVATISDTSGNLLFYTDGITVYNAVHTIMTNGTGLQGDPSSTQAAIIVRRPSSNNEFYIFTIDDASGSYGLRYSIVDITLSGGLGAVTAKNVLVYASAKEKLTSVRHANGTDFWIIVNSFANDDIRAFLLSSTGVDTNAVVSNIGPINNGIPAATGGYIKASRQNNRLAMGVLYNNNFVIVDFDNNTGVADSASRITIGDHSTTNNAYGVEFSPDGTKLYGTTLSAPRLVLQFDLSSGIDSVIFNTRDTLDYSPVTSCGSFFFGALQLAPDGKIYGVCQCDSFLNVINNPDALGAACGYVPKAVGLSGKKCDLGLPNFISDYVLPTSISEHTKAFTFNVYPNPNNGNFLINIDPVKSSAVHLSIRNIIGELINEINLTTKTTEINLEQPAGIYFLTTSTDREIYTTKISIQ